MTARHSRFACRFLLLLALCVASATLWPGCSAAGGWNPAGWFTKRGERAVERAVVKRKAAADDVLTKTQRLVEEAVMALLTAPASRPVEVASEAVTQASALLAQVNGPLTAPQLAAVRKQVTALLSDNEALRAEGERLRAEQREKDAAASQALASAQREAEAAQARASKIAADNAELAGRFLWAKWAAAGLTLLSLLGGVLAVAYRANAFGFASRVAEGLIGIERKHGAETADTARTFLDMALDVSDKSKVFAAVAKFAPDIAARVRK